MGRNKSRNNIDLDTLLNIASTPKLKKVKPKKTYPEIDTFISEFKIEAGKAKIPTYIIYYKYYLWKQMARVPRLKFITYLKTKFQKIKTVDGMGFLLNPKPFDLTPQGYFKARAILRNERDEKAKTKTQQS